MPTAKSPLRRRCVGKGRKFRGVRGRLIDSLFGAALAGYQYADALDHLGGRGGSLRRKDISLERAVEGIDSAGDDHRRKARVDLFGATDEFVTVHLRHQEIAQ